MGRRTGSRLSRWKNLRLSAVRIRLQETFLVWLNFNSRLLQDSSECSFWHIAGMIWNRCVAAGRRVVPYLMITGGLTVKLESKGPQLSNDFAIAKSREAAHGQAATTIV